MARTRSTKKISIEKSFPVIKAGSKEKEALLSIGYNMDRAKAETIISERNKNPISWPYEMLEKAQAFLAALETEPIPVSLRDGWRRSPTYPA